MKILNVKIISPENEVVRDIPFNESGISIILADIQEKDDSKETINSLRKTLLLKMIDYLLGSNKHKIFSKDEIKDYIVEGYVKYNEFYYSCSRLIGNSENNTINCKKYSLKDYKNFFSISRRCLDKQVFLEEKNSLISTRENPSCSDYNDFLSLLNLDNIGEKSAVIYETQDRIKQLKKNKKSLLESYDSMKSSNLEEDIFLLDKRVDEYEEKLFKLTKKIEKIQTTSLKESVFEEYTDANIKFKTVKSNIEKNKIERKRLENFIEESNKTDITSEDVIAIYNQAKVEVPEMIKREIIKVQEFHEKVYLERKEYLNEKILSLEKTHEELELEFNDLTSKINHLGILISENKAYKEAIMYYEKFTKELSDLKFRQGQLSQLKNIQSDIDKGGLNLTKYFEEAKLVLEDNQEMIKKYKNFIYDLVKLIYTEDVDAFFDINIKKRHLTRRPIDIELNLKGDTGEGVGNVRKLLIDYLIFNYNKKLNILIQDSSCYNGIDPRQVTSMIKELDNLAKNSNKQAIVTLNKYQLISNDISKEFFKEKCSIVLSEKDKIKSI